MWIENLSTAKEMSKKVLMTCTLILERDDILTALRSDFVMVHGEKYKTPERQLLDILYHRSYNTNSSNTHTITFELADGDDYSKLVEIEKQ